METNQKKKRRWPLYVGLALVGFIAFSVMLTPDQAELQKKGEKFIEETKKASVEQIEIVEYNEAVTEYSRTVYVTLRNKSAKLANAIAVKAIYKDATGKVVGTASGLAPNVPSGETRVANCISTSIQNAATYQIQLEYALFE